MKEKKVRSEMVQNHEPKRLYFFGHR